jgi:tetratricopeptide (TPR) repeat protein
VKRPLGWRSLLDRAVDVVVRGLVALARRISGAAGREWLDALTAELEAIDSRTARLVWSLGGLRIAWNMNDRRRARELLRTWGLVVIAFAVVVLLVPARTPLLLAAAMVIAVGSVAAVKATNGGNGLLVLKSPAFGIPVAVLGGGLLVLGASAAYGAATEPDTQCTSVHTTTSQPPPSLVSAADFLALGDFDFDRGACNEAIADYTRAIDLDAQFAAAYNNRAYTNMRQQNYAAALPDLDRAIELRPDYANALMNRGDIYNYYYAIDRQRAIADYDRIIALGQSGQGSVCGHRMLAYYGGWSPRVFVDVLLHGTDVGCTLH